MTALLSNFIPINRKLFKHEFWQEQRPYSRFEAWLDLLVTARFDNTQGRMVIGCTTVRWNRGQLVASTRYLGERWRWGKTKVANFLNWLKNEKMIVSSTAEGTLQTIITICNYDTYNAITKTDGQPDGQHADTTGTTARQDKDKTNKANKEPIIKEREIYRGFAHLCLFTGDYLKLIDDGHTPSQINNVLDEIENYKNNKKYNSLYLTAKNWLQKNREVAAARSSPQGRIVNIAGAFQQALRHG